MKAVYVAARGQGHQPAQLAQKKLTELMSTPVRCVSDQARLSDALSIMVSCGRRHLAVVDGSQRCVGVLGDRAIAAAWALYPGDLNALSVTAALDPGPALLGMHATVVEAARLMRKTGVDAVVIIDERGAPVGIATGSDLIGQLASQTGSTT